MARCVLNHCVGGSLFCGSPCCGSLCCGSLCCGYPVVVHCVVVTLLWVNVPAPPLFPTVPHEGGKISENDAGFAEKTLSWNWHQRYSLNFVVYTP